VQEFKQRLLLASRLIELLSELIKNAVSCAELTNCQMSWRESELLQVKDLEDGKRLNPR
jgi:hypothetical protein